jgi:hypothetical protein
MPFVVDDYDLYGTNSHYIIAIFDREGRIRTNHDTIIYDPKKKNPTRHQLLRMVKYSLSTILPEHIKNEYTNYRYASEKYHQMDDNDFTNSAFYIISYAHQFLLQDGKAEFVGWNLSNYVKNITQEALKDIESLNYGTDECENLERTSEYLKELLLFIK